MNLASATKTSYRLLSVLIIVCIHGGGGGLMHKMKMMKEHHENQHKGITIGIKAIKVPIPIPIAMPYMENQMMMMKGHHKGMKKKMKGEMMMKMMDKMMKMKMMKMMMKMKMKEMKMTKMKGHKCKPKCVMMKTKCEPECPEACPEMMDNSCKGCSAMKSDWPSTGMMMNNGWPPMMMMNNGWPSPAKGWPSPMMKGMMKAMCPECPPCDDPVEERPEEMEPDYYDEELEEDQNAWDSNLVPVYERIDNDVKMKGYNIDEAFLYTFDKHLHINAVKLPLRQEFKISESNRREEYDFDY